jgi:hypothetical protein
MKKARYMRFESPAVYGVGSSVRRQRSQYWMWRALCSCGSCGGGGTLAVVAAAVVAVTAAAPRAELPKLLLPPRLAGRNGGGKEEDMDKSGKGGRGDAVISFPLCFFLSSFSW